MFTVYIWHVVSACVSAGAARERVSVSPPAESSGASAGRCGAAGGSEGGAAKAERLSVRPAGALHSPSLSAAAAAPVHPAAAPALLLQSAGYRLITAASVSSSSALSAS